MTSRIDELQRLHEAYRNPSPFGGPGDFDRWSQGVQDAWPAIHRVLVAARMLMQCPRCIGPCDDPAVHAEIEDALRALDEKKPQP